jgi:hypothetical protein
MPTPGQHEALIAEVRHEETLVMGPAPISAPFSGSAVEYKQTMNDIEAYEKLLEEGSNT